MVTEILHPGTVTVSPNALHPGVIVGGSPQWDDGSDSSYATAYLSMSPSAAVQGRAVATLSTMTTAPADVTAITLHVRFKTANTGAAYQRRVGFALWNGTVGEFAGFGYADPSDPSGFYQAPADEAIHDLAIPLAADDLTAYGTSLSAVAARLASGGVQFRAFRYSPIGAPSTVARYEMTVYEMWLEINPSDEEPVVNKWPVWRPLRMHPRSDALGMSSVRRYGTNPRSVQASLRRGGGTYI